MTDEKMQTIQEKIYAEQLKKQEKIHADNLKIQEKFNKTQEILVNSNKKSLNFEKNEKTQQVLSKSKDIADEYIKKDIKSQNIYTGYNYDKDYSYRSNSSISSIFSGIMVMVVGFAILTIGNLIINSISKSLVIDQNSYETINYVSSILPLFGLALLVLGFATVLFTLRTSMG